MGVATRGKRGLRIASPFLRLSRPGEPASALLNPLHHIGATAREPLFCLRFFVDAGPKIAREELSLVAIVQALYKF